MSVDAEFSDGPSILTGEKLPEVGNSAVACENASSSGAVVFTKETSNCPADKGQMEHNTASEITSIEEMSGESGGSDKGNDDEKLSNGAEAANAGNSEDKLQCDQSEKTENADTDGGQGALSLVSEIEGVNESGGDFNGGVNLVCEESADTGKVESNGQKAPSAEIKVVEEIIGESNGSRKNDKSVDAEKGDINSSMAIDPVTETMVGMERMRGESSVPHRSNDDRILSEESADTEKVESDGQGEPITVTEIKAFEEIGGEFNGSSKNDMSVDDEKGDINSSMSINPVTETASMKEMRGESSGPHRSNDDRRLSEESADTEKVENDCQREPITVTEIKAVEEIRGESNGSSKNDESVDDEKGDINSSMAINPVTEKVGMEEVRDESGGPHRSNDDRILCEESSGAEKVDRSCQGAPHLDMEMTRMEHMGCLSSFVQNSSEDKSLSDQCENAGNEDSNGQSALNLNTKIEGINEVGGDSNCEVKLVCEGSADSEKVEINGQRAPSTVTEIEEIRSASNGSSKIDESTDAEKAGSNNSMATNIVTEISGLEGRSDGIEKINIISEITGIDVESNGAEEVSNDKLVHQESTNIEKLDSQGQKVSNILSEIKGIEDIEGESDVTNKRTDVNSTSEDRKDEIENGSTQVHKGEILCSTDAVASGKENVNSSDDDVQNVCNTVFDTICNDEIGCKSDGDKEIDNKVMHQRDEDYERLHSDGLASEEMSNDAELSHVPSISTDARLSEVENFITSISRVMCSNDAIALGNEACNSCISHGQSPADMVQEIIGKAVGGESNGVDRSNDDNLMYEDFEYDKRFNCSSPAAEGMSCNAEFSQGLSTSVDQFSEVGNYCASSTKDVSSNDAVRSENEALNSSTDNSQLLGPNLIREGSGVENLEGELNGGDNSINSGILHKKCEDPEKSHNGSDNVGAHGDAEFSIDQSVLVDVKLCKAGNSSTSSIKDECCDVVCGNTLNDTIHECKRVPNVAIDFTDIKKEGESSVADQTSDDKFICESEDAEKPPNINIDERMSCNDEICHDQVTLAYLLLSEAGNTSSSRDASSYDAATFENETLTCPIETDQESANMSTEIAGTEEMTGGSNRSNDDKLICEQSGDDEISNTNKELATSAECSSVDVAAVRDMNGIAAKGFYFLIRMPRFDDEKIRERIKVAELNVDEKTQHRDALRQKIRNRRANCQTHGAEFEAAKAQERDARKQVRTKRADISTLQDIIDKAKNAVAIGEIDNRICHMEHIIGHETVPLKEEKLLIREIKQLTQLRGQLSSNIGSQDEVQKSLDERDVNEERLRALKKELDNLKVKASKAETIAMAASRKFEDESRKLKELQAQFKAADDIRQEAYEELRNLKKGLYEKNIHFRTYKDEATLASDHTEKREIEALNHLCVNQVERYMELWNKNDDFRKDYIRCNIRSTVRRFGTLDGRTLGPDEEPTVLPSYRVERVNRLVASVDKVNCVSQPPVPQQEKQVVVLKDDNIVLQAAEGIYQVEKTKETWKPIERESTFDEPKEAEHLQTAQELEAARKEEELRKREEAARLKEQRRLEEIAKAKEALERKKRNAEKAQLRAELRAQKEEEQRLKEREKRLRKKERKKGSVGETQSESNDGETALISTTPKETVKETESTENPQTTTKKPQKPSQYTKQMKTKSIPPPLRNRSRRKLQQWIWLTLSCIVVIALFFLGNIGFFSNLKPLRSPGF